MKPTARSPPSSSNRTFYPAAQFVPAAQPNHYDDAERRFNYRGSPAIVSSPRLTFQSPGRVVNLRGSSPMEVVNVPRPVFQRPNNGSNLQGSDSFEVYSGKKIHKEMQANPGFIAPPSPHTVGYGRNHNTHKSPVSNLFDRMIESSLSGSSSELTSNSGANKWTSRIDDHRTSPHVTGDQFANQLRHCSSQNDLGELDATTKTGMSWKASNAAETLSLGKPSSSRPIYAYDSIPVDSSDSGIYSNQPSLNRDYTKPIVRDAFGNRPEKMAFLRGAVHAAPAKHSHHREHVQHDSHRVNEFSESEEPLPVNYQPGLTERKRSGDAVESSLRDLQLTVFMRDATPNKSFDTGESRYINKPYQRMPVDSRPGGSMPYRVKKPNPLNISNPSLESERVLVSESGWGSPPLITPLNSGEISSSVFTPSQPRYGATGSPAMVRSGEDVSGSPSYTGPRLVPVECVRGSTGSESRSRVGSESQDFVTAERLAKRLFDLDGFRKSDVVKHLGKRTEFSQLVRESYLRNFDFTSMTLDVALRHFLSHLVLSGETQERERVLAQFSQRFSECNLHSFGSQDACHVLVCGIMILNTDLHRENGRKRMTVHEFIENLSGQNGGADFPKDLLKNIYHSIKNEPIEFQVDAEEANPDSSKDEKSVQLQANPFLDIPDPSKVREFKTGSVMRKCCIESDGRRTPMGKRGWKMFRASLRELILYLHKDEHGFNCGTTFDDTSNAIRIHHSLAMDASDYGKRHDVFRMRAADWSEYLFQASDSEECQSWIDTINGVAAAFSSPPLPGAVGSQVKFQRPLMPSSSTKLSLQDQLAQHEQTLGQVEKDLAEHREFAPEKGAKPRLIQDYLDKETYLEFEQRRFRTYCVAIQSMLQSNVDLTKTETAESYFERMKKAHGSGRFSRKAFANKEDNSSSTKDSSEVDNTDGEKKNRLPGATANLYHGLQPAKSVPALLYESRV